MRRIAILLVFGGVLLLGASPASAQSVTASGNVDWTALTGFTALSGKVVFFDFATGESVVAPLTKLDTKIAPYSVSLTPGDFYLALAVVGNCTGDPETCGTTTMGGTHIRFGGLAEQAPSDGSPLPVDLVADGSLSPVAVCGTVSVQAGTFVKLSASIDNGTVDSPLTDGVFSTALIAAPTASYCLLGAQFSVGVLNATTTIAQSQIPNCPAQVDIPHSDVLFFGTDPITDDLQIVVPGPPGEIKGTFSITGFPAAEVEVDGSNSGPTIGACAGLSSYSASGPEPLSFDINPALAGQWTVSGGAGTQANSADGLLQITQFTSATSGSANGLFTFDVEAGRPVVPSLSYRPGVVSGNISIDGRRWGAPFSGLSRFVSFEGAVASGSTGAEWFTTAIVIMPVQASERYNLYLDPRGTDWTLEAVEGIGFQYQFPVPNGSVSSGYNNAVALPNVGGRPPFVEFGNLAVLVGHVAAGTHTTIDLPPIDFHVASVTLNAVPDGPSISWFAEQGTYPLGSGVLGTTSPGMQSFSFDTSTAVGRAMFPPGRYDGSTISNDANFNQFSESRSLDLEPDDDLTSDFGAPMLLSVRPIPGASGGRTTVSGKVVSGDPAVTALQVFVNGASATVRAGGSFSMAAVIGTGPLTIIARDNLGRTTTLKRYFTSMTGLFPPCEGADLVSQNEDVYAITNFVFQPPLPKNSFNVGRTIPLKLAGALAGVPVTSANATAPRLVALVNAAPGMAPTTITPTGNTTFSSAGGQWTYELSTRRLQPGTYVAQIRFWDGRILEAAFVLR